MSNTYEFQRYRRTAYPQVEIAPISECDIPAVGDFMAAEMASRTSAADWRRLMTPDWDVEQPNAGYLMRVDGDIVGAYLALYSERTINGRVHLICNLGAWCVAEPYRAAGLRLVRSLLRQKGYTFTDLTPNPDVVALNNRLGFATLDTATAMVPNVAWPRRLRGTRLIDSPEEIVKVLSEPQLGVYRDHATSTARHAVLVHGDECCHVMYRRDWYLGLPLFATVLYVGDRELFRRVGSRFYCYLLLRRGIPATLAETRVVGHRPVKSISVPGRKRMFIGDGLAAEDIDYLYSELTCLRD